MWYGSAVAKKWKDFNLREYLAWYILRGLQICDELVSMGHVMKNTLSIFVLVNLSSYIYFECPKSLLLHQSGF